MQEAIVSMSTLNLIGAELGSLESVHALTDVTGFGLLGHLIEMCDGSGLSAELDYASVPLMKNVKELSAKFIYADNTMRNWKSYESSTQGIVGESLLTLCDPQTSGGLLIAVSGEKEAEVTSVLQKNDLPVSKIGRMVARKSKAILVR